jgi:glycosyltransferase involved in cell wall biosynthesis
LLSWLYRLAFRGAGTVFFHNEEDRALFVQKRLVEPGQAAVVPGSGVDLGRFRPRPLPGGNDDPVFLYVGRLLSEKGVREFAEASALAKRRLPHARFRILGPKDNSSRGVPVAEIDRWVAEGAVEYLGAATDVVPHIEAADCVVLPSYREGLPKVLLEAGAMARPVIAADVPGCRQAVLHSETGFLCEPRSGPALASAMIEFARLSPADRTALGLRGRRHVEERFSDDEVAASYLSAIRRVCDAVPVG